MDNLTNKYQALKDYLAELESVAVAFSGGVDSTFLLKVANDVLGKNAVAVTARSESFPKCELLEATAYAEELGADHFIIDSEELDIEGFSHNPKNRCYLCKSELFTKIKEIATLQKLKYVVEGSNIDDDGDYRPGLLAVTELGIKSPLRFAKLSKNEIRELSKELNLPTWNKQSFACLSSRFPYGENITPDRLHMIDQAEQYLLDLGFHQVRVRYHGDLARIETDETGFDVLLDKDNRNKIHNRFKTIGFTYISLDLKGYRTGSMNETL